MIINTRALRRLWPSKIETESVLEELISRPSPETVRAIQRIDGDIIILGAGGKIGPSLAILAKRAIEEAGVEKKVIAVSRFSASEIRQKLNKAGVEAIRCDLLERDEVNKLPEVSNVIYMVGRKFGTKGDEPLTWATNTYIPALIAQKFRNSRIVVFSTGNVYPLVPVSSGGATESDPPSPIGEYAQSCLGRERIFEYFCRKFGTKAIFLRLNYAIELRYGVLLDVASKVFRGEPIDLRMGYVNVIWQGDVNNVAIQSLTICQNPPKILNVTGPEIISIRWLATRFGEIFGKKPIFQNEEMETALLSNASEYHRIFGYPKVTLKQMIEWVAHWILIGGPTWNKPTHYDVRNGRF